MRYLFRCRKPTCHKEFDHDLSMVDVGTPKEPPTHCPFCGAVAERIITGGAGFILKGSPGSWPSKRLKLKHDRQKRSEELEVKQYDRYGLHGGAEMVPNYEGDIKDSWREVRAHAAAEATAKGVPLDPLHDHMVFKEEALKKVTTKTMVQTTRVIPVATPTQKVAKAPALRKTFKVE